MTESSAHTEPRAAQDGARAAGDGSMLTAREVAGYLGMSARWVHERVRRREIPYYKFGASLRFDRDEVRRWTERYWSAPTGRGRDRERARL
jgi:excisionase family DNA binding protein